MRVEVGLQRYIQEHIPLSNALGMQVVLAAPEKIIISAPFTNNINHKATVFGGSLHAVATLSCWGLLHLQLKDAFANSDIVIVRSEVDFLAPVTHDFEAVCVLPDMDTWNKFKRMLDKKGKGRIALQSSISMNGKLAVNYQGLFAVIKNK